MNISRQPANIKSFIIWKNSMSAEQSNSNSQTKVFNSAELFAAEKQVFIEHNGEIYTLKITKNGKLLLVK